MKQESNMKNAMATPKQEGKDVGIENEPPMMDAPSIFLKTPREKFSNPSCIDNFLANSGHKINVSPFFHKK